MYYGVLYRDKQFFIQNQAPATVEVELFTENLPGYCFLLS